MAENDKLTLARVLQFLIPAAGVTVAIVSVLLSVASRKKELTCTLLNSTRLVSENLGGISPDMRVEFRGQPIFSLSKMTFSLRNTGSAAVRSQDVSEPVHLQFPAGAKLLNASVEKTSPLKFSFSTKSFPETSQVELDFPLLNSGDEGIFSVYLLNSDLQRPSFEGRVVDVPQLVYAESLQNTDPNAGWPHWSHATRTIIRWTLLVLYGLLTAGSIGMLLYEIVTRIRDARWKPRWSKLFQDLEKELLARENAERDKEWDRVVKESANLNPAEKEAYRKANAPKYDFDARRRRLREECKKRGIPPEPGTITGSLGDFVSFSLVFAGIAVLFAVTAIVVHTALPG